MHNFSFLDLSLITSSLIFQCLITLFYVSINMEASVSLSGKGSDVYLGGVRLKYRSGH
jgi:hypothetical protein